MLQQTASDVLEADESESVVDDVEPENPINGSARITFDDSFNPAPFQIQTDHTGHAKQNRPIRDREMLLIAMRQTIFVYHRESKCQRPN
jgi:hypothetical protein